MLRGEGKSATPTPNSGRYDFIQTPRYIRGEHASTSRGPSVDKFKCGSFFNTGDSGTARSDVVEDSTNLVVSSTSFRRHDWVCISFDIEHSCGPLRASKHIRANVFPLAENKLEKLRRHLYVYAALT